jgi:hypothetical protein
VELIGTSPLGWIGATGHHRLTGARREESSREAKIGKLANEWRVPLSPMRSASARSHGGVSAFSPDPQKFCHRLSE